MPNDSFIEEELKELRQKCSSVEGSRLTTCNSLSVRVKIRKNQCRQLEVCLQFSENYPNTPVIMELKSKTLSDKLLDGLIKVCDGEAKKLLGKKQILPILRLIKQFLDDNPFASCSDELAYLKKNLITENDDFKTKQKSGIITITIRKYKYFYTLCLTIPENYPEEQVNIKEQDNNFPPLLSRVLIGQATEIARRCVQPPLRKKPNDPPFQPRPSLKTVANFLIEDCIRRYPAEICQLCKKKALPEDPKDVVNDEENKNFVEKVYCGHLYHNGCLDTYMKTPPFQGGKKCPGCGHRIYHDKWNATPKLAEDRWAHKEAKQRELEEVEDFFQ